MGLLTVMVNNTFPMQAQWQQWEQARQQWMQRQQQWFQGWAQPQWGRQPQNQQEFDQLKQAWKTSFEQWQQEQQQWQLYWFNQAQVRPAMPQPAQPVLPQPAPAPQQRPAQAPALAPKWIQSAKPQHIAGWDLGRFRYDAASVLPIYSKYEASEGRNVDYVILTQERYGRDRGTYDDFGGKRDQGENNAVITAAREFWEEAFETAVLGMNRAQTQAYIDLSARNTEYVIANAYAGSGSSMVTYITRFSRETMRPFKERFAREAAKGRGEKDSIATVRLEDLALAALTHQLKVDAYVMDTHGNQHKTQIPLRPILPAKLRPFFENKEYRPSNDGDTRIRFYNTPGQ